MRLLYLWVLLLLAGCAVQAQPSLGLRHFYLTLPEGQAHSGVWAVAHLTRAPSGQEIFQHGTQRLAAKVQKCRFAGKERWLLRAFLPTQPDRVYRLQCLDGSRQLGEVSFRSLPSSGDLRFCDGGDCDLSQEFRQLLTLAGQHSPHFMSFGGDLAYENGEPSELGRFDAWLDAVQKHLRTPDGLSVPWLPVLGNHEVRGAYGQLPQRATFYLPFLNRNQDQTYAFRQFPQGLGFWSLDSGHCASVNGPQLQWLEQSLEQHQQLPVKLASYHVPLYPSVRDFDDEFSRPLRQHWRPVFDKYHVTVALEHHDHALKRTWPLRQDQPHPQGTVYLGDGCLGREARPCHPERPYLAQASSQFHFWSWTLNRQGWKAEAIGLEGQVLDQATP